MDKHTAVQEVVDAVTGATRAINTHGSDSAEALSALQTARAAVTTARQHGASDDELRAARPA
jgi:hypothetical protein